MKKRYVIAVLVSILYSVTGNCQSQLYFETFNGATNTFTINDTGLGRNSGNNEWIIDTNYFAGGIYPKTNNENNTYLGTITGAPYSQYLHIYDSASKYLNDNYNPNDSSTRFAHMTAGICTKSLTNINFNFYYLCQGSPTAFGSVYYSIDGGPWIMTGTVSNGWAGDTLKSKYKWQYATITNPAFTNVEDLKFGFLWHNNKAAGKDTSGLGVDDISIYGTYDSIAHPITCTFFNFNIGDTCLGNSPAAFFSATLTDSTCTATWYAYMSMPNGTFPGNGLGWYQSVGEYNYNDISQYWYLTLPLNFNTEGCYVFKLQRASYPYLTFTDTVCFPFDSCPGTIQTILPPATLDTNPICAGSVIDVPFWSTGVYGTYNVYTALLIDSIGHTATTYTVGTLPSNVAYPASAFPPAPGDVVSTIPLTVPAGCHYYLEVVSSTGNRKPTPWGPFCIQHCEIKTNNQQSIPEVCLKSCKNLPQGYYDTITYNDSLDRYYTGNKFEIQLISFMLYPPSFGAINTGLFGVKVDTSNGHFKLLLHVPCPDTLFANGINPGVYYMRVIADSSHFPDSALGSLVQITIGEPADNMTLTFSTFPAGIQPPYCTGDQFIFYANPNDGGPPYNSTYQWWYTDKRNGRLPEPASFDQSSIALTANIADTFVVSCQETNYGCSGNIAVSDTIIVLGPPPVIKTGPLTICEGDTGTYSIPFQGNTTYIWEIPTGLHADTSNNVLKIKFDKIGTVRFSVKALNYCFTDSANWTVKVIAPPVPSVSVSPTSICSGETATLTASGGASYLWSNGKKTASIKVTPTGDTSYTVGVSNAGCKIDTTIKLTVYPIPNVKVSYCVGDTVIMGASGANSYIWNPSVGLIINDSIAKGEFSSIETFTVYGTTSHGCKDSTIVNVNPAIKTNSISTATTISAGASVQLSVQGGEKWFWSPSTGLNNDSIQNPIATPSSTTTYTVVIKDSNGCILVDTVTVDVTVNCGVFVPEVFTPSDPNNHNTILYVRSECLTTVDFEIFDRWGNKVFETLDINKGWDGTYKGSALNPATFVYYVTGKTADGRTLTQKGNVTLVK